MKPYTTVLLLGLLAPCCFAKPQRLNAPAQEVSYCELVKTPMSFSGKRIRVRAIYKYGFEIQRLEQPTCCPNAAKIWVEIHSGLEGNSLKLFRKFPKGMGLALATFVGTFESGGPYGDGGYRLKFSVDQIEKLEATAKPSPSREPAWVPKNCESSKAATETVDPKTGNRRLTIPTTTTP